MIPVVLGFGTVVIGQSINASAATERTLLTVALLIAAGAVWVLGQRFNGDAGRVLVDKETGREIRLRRRHYSSEEPMNRRIVLQHLGLVLAVAIFATALLAPSVPAWATVAAQENVMPVTRFSPADADVSDFFGSATAMSGNTLVVGAQVADVEAPGSYGSAYVFTLDEATDGNPQWVQQAELTMADEEKFVTNFGQAVDIDSDTVIVGSNYNPQRESRGGPWIFVREGEAWVRQARLTAGLLGEDEQLGYSVAVDGDTAAVGVWQRSMADGVVYVFVRNGTAWSLQATLTGTANDQPNGDLFGQSVDIDGDTLAVGARHGGDGQFSTSGAVYLFTRSGTEWTQQAKLNHPRGEEAVAAELGNAVALEGDVLVAGARNEKVGGEAVHGAAYVFRRSGSVWKLASRLTHRDGDFGDNFGWAVDVADGNIIIGAYWKDIGSNDKQGAAYLYAPAGGGWFPRGRLTAADGSARDALGSDVATNGTVIVAGAPQASRGDDTLVGAIYAVGVDSYPAVRVNYLPLVSQ